MRVVVRRSFSLGLRPLVFRGFFSSRMSINTTNRGFSCTLPCAMAEDQLDAGS